MIRTQIYLPEELYTHVKLLAQQKKQSAANIIRQLIQSGVQKKSVSIGQALQTIVNIKAKGPSDLSTNHDSYYLEQ